MVIGQFFLKYNLTLLIVKCNRASGFAKGTMPMRDAIVSDGTMRPRTKTVGRPGIWISHTCVDWIFLPSGKLIVRG